MHWNNLDEHQTPIAESGMQAVSPTSGSPRRPMDSACRRVQKNEGPTAEVVFAIARQNDECGTGTRT
jgi:hypothetical protein